MDACQIEQLFKDTNDSPRPTDDLFARTKKSTQTRLVPINAVVLVSVQNAMRVQNRVACVRVKKKKRRWFILPISIQRPTFKNWKGAAATVTTMMMMGCRSLLVPAPPLAVVRNCTLELDASL